MVTLAVQVIRIKCLDSFKHPFIMPIHQLMIYALSMPGTRLLVGLELKLTDDSNSDEKYSSDCPEHKP